MPTWSGAARTHEDRVFHVRTPARKEIDFVSTTLGGVAVEGKYIDSGRWVRGGRHGERVGVGRRHRDPDRARHVLATAWAVPAAFVAYLIDR
jgi:hypothetical protein